MSNFIKLRLILQQPKPVFQTFVGELEKQALQKGDLDLLLRKAVEGRVGEFPKFCRALVSKGASVNFQDSKDHISNLMIACERGNTEMVSALLAHKEINLLHADARQLHAGFYAVDNKSREDGEAILRQLLEKEPALVNREAGNQTLLIAAIRKCKVELVKLLLEAGADPNWQVPDTGNTALHDAVKQFKTKISKTLAEIIRLLLLHGGDSLKKNKQQKTVYEYAERSLAEYQKIEQLVKEQLLEAENKVEVIMELNSPADIEQMLAEGEMLFQKYEPEEEEQDTFLSESLVLAGLTEDIRAFEKDCLLEYELARKEVDIWMAKVNKILSADGFMLEEYGSFATGLWVKQSNVDLFIVRRDYPYDFNGINLKDFQQKFTESLKKANICRSTLITRNSRVPSIRVEIGEVGRIKLIHLTILDRTHNERAITRFITEQRENYPLLRPLFYVLKQLSCCYRLNEAKNGGIRTYALVIMLLSCMAKWNEPSPAKLLLDFLYYFGFYYDYHYEAKTDLLDPLEKELMVLHILDPLNPNNNVGKQVRAVDLQRMFRAAYIALHANIDAGHKLTAMFDTRHIMLP